MRPRSAALSTINGKVDIVQEEQVDSPQERACPTIKGAFSAILQKSTQ